MTIHFDVSGTASVVLTLPRSNGGTQISPPINGCFVKKDANLKPVVRNLIPPSAHAQVDWNRFKNCQFLFYAPAVDGLNGNVTDATISYWKIRKKLLKTEQQLMKSFKIANPLILMDHGHLFLCCDSKDVNKSKFLKNNSKLVRPNQTLGQFVYGLGSTSPGEDYDKPLFIRFELMSRCQSNNGIHYAIDGTDYRKLQRVGPLLLDGNKTTVGCYKTIDNNMISISIFDNHGGPPVGDSPTASFPTDPPVGGSPTASSPTDPPVGDSPTSSSPTDPPVGDSPTSSSPTDPPVGDSPTASSPTDPLVGDSPTASSPTDRPVGDSPTVSFPTDPPVDDSPTASTSTDPPVDDSPTASTSTDPPVGDSPTASSPTDPPVADSPTASSPTDPPAGDSPTVSFPTDPPVDDSLTASTSTDPPVGDSPTASSPTDPPVGDSPTASSPTDPPVGDSSTVSSPDQQSDNEREDQFEESGSGGIDCDKKSETISQPVGLAYESLGKEDTKADKQEKGQGYNKKRLLIECTDSEKTNSDTSLSASSSGTNDLPLLDEREKPEQKDDEESIVTSSECSDLEEPDSKQGLYVSLPDKKERLVKENSASSVNLPVKPPEETREGEENSFPFHAQEQERQNVEPLGGSTASSLHCLPVGGSSTASLRPRPLAGAVGGGQRRDSNNRSSVPHNLPFPCEQQVYLESLLARDPGIVQTLGHYLDRKSLVLKNHEHLAALLDAPPIIKAKCNSNTEHSPTLDLLQLPKVSVISVNDLVGKLRKISRNDLADKIEANIISEHDRRSQILTAFRKYEGLFEEIANVLDQSRVCYNWFKLGRELGIPRDELEQIKLGCNPAKRLLQDYAYPTFKSHCSDKLTVGCFLQHINMMERCDIQSLLGEFGINQNAYAARSIEDVIPRESDIMWKLCLLLNKSIYGVTKDWKYLAELWRIPHQVYSQFTPQSKVSPTKILLEWLIEERSKVTVNALCFLLGQIGRNDAKEFLEIKLRERSETTRSTLVT